MPIMIIKSLDLTQKVRQAHEQDDVHRELVIFMADVLNRIDFFPFVIKVSIEAGDDFWKFVADVKKA